ncbi:hypothetical protein BLGI_4441 [Brevibacillus laterosporus GI-9]|uniref:hypothetical protein n=1 Tax=Brevibacillus laterosporus TaxID=1465 RepID=UPI0002405402|nr:hypothetical protein [Brevibacillus laterosporus]CCF16472.1 hypothetical protein BLGI_4441 [Brevibacillus laterosporus GI-9]
MSIKMQCRIKLPYILRLKEPKDYEEFFSFPEFDFFKLTLLFNDIEYESIYIDDHAMESCKYLQIEVISPDYDYQKYRVMTIKRNSEDVEYNVDDVPEQVEVDIMRKIALRLNEILDYIKESTKMFWITEIPINPVSDMIGEFTSYYFFAPTATPRREMTYQITTVDNYMESGVGKIASGKVYDNLLPEFHQFQPDNYRLSIQFVEKALHGLYSGRFYDAIIFAAIAQESFITKYIEDNAIQEDIIYKKLNEINGHLMDLKYNVLLKYIKGKSLVEIDPALYSAVLSVYKLRNSIMHTGKITNDNLQEAGIPRLDFEQVNRLIKSVNKAIDKIKTM